MKKSKKQSGIFLIVPACLITIVIILASFQTSGQEKINTRQFDSAATKTKTFIVNTVLPAQVPHLNKPENYLVGTGVVCVSGMTDGTWNFIAGPDYTSPNFITSEKLTVKIDNVEFTLPLIMYRARMTGIYYGVCTIGDLEITVLDHSYEGRPWIARFVNILNKSLNRSYDVQLQASIHLKSGNGRTSGIVRNNQNKEAGLSVCLDTSLFSSFGDSSGWVRNSQKKYMAVAWNDAGSATEKITGGYVITSGTKKIAENKSAGFTLYHYMHYAGKPEREYINLIQKSKGTSDAKQSIDYWRNWFQNVPPEYSLDRIKDQRARDIVEGGLSVLKSNQCIEGGLVANEAYYNLAWTRDAYCGLRGLAAMGHTNELKRFIQFMNKKYKVHQFIPNAVSCGTDVFALYNGNRENNPMRRLGAASPCPESNTAPETPALLILAARDYYQASNDLKTLIDADSSLRYSMNIQLKHLINNGYKLEFSGDETELCGAVSTVSAGYDRDLSKLWSMSSVALAIASLEFYIDYLQLRKQDPSSYLNSLDGKRLNLSTELTKLKEAIDRDFWRTDRNEFPNGYYEWSKIKKDNSFPPGSIVNFSLFPSYYKVNLNFQDRAVRTIEAMAGFYNSDQNKIPLVPKAGDGGFLGHNLGYLLWSLVSVNDNRKSIVYDALINGNTAQCWGTFNEAYDADGNANSNNLRTFETGVNIDAIARYWNIGKK